LRSPAPKPHPEIGFKNQSPRANRSSEATHSNNRNNYNAPRLNPQFLKPTSPARLHTILLQAAFVLIIAPTCSTIAKMGSFATPPLPNANNKKLKTTVRGEVMLWFVTAVRILILLQVIVGMARLSV